MDSRTEEKFRHVNVALEMLHDQIDLVLEGGDFDAEGFAYTLRTIVDYCESLEIST